MERKDSSAEIITLDALMSQDIGSQKEEVEKPNDTFIIEEDKKEDLLGLEGASEETVTQTEEVSEEEPVTEDLETPPTESEENTEEVVEEVTEEEVPVVAKGNYLESIKNLFGDDISHIIQEDENGTEQEIPISDVEFTQELFEEVVKAQVSKIKEEAKENTIPTDGISEFTRELIEIDRNGGDVSTLLKAKETYTDVLDRLDLTKAEDQKTAVFLRYKAGDRYTDEEINILIKGYEQEGTLETKAEQADQEIREAVKNQVDRVKQQAEEDKANKAKLLKVYRKEVRDKMDQFDLDDRIKAKAVKLGTQTDEKGRFEIDNFYKKMKEDPETAAKLFLFLLDTSEYDKQVGREVKKTEQLKSAGRISIIKKDTSSGTKERRKTNKGEESILISDLLDKE